MEPIVSRLELWNLEVTQGAGSQEWLEAYECMGYTKIKVESLLVIVHLSAYMKWERFYARKDALNVKYLPWKGEGWDGNSALADTDFSEPSLRRAWRWTENGRWKVSQWMCEHLSVPDWVLGPAGVFRG